MRSRASIAAFFVALFRVTAAAQASIDAPSPEEIARETSARDIFYKMLEKTHFGFSHLEEVAFIVRDENGALSSVPWPSTGEPDMGLWAGAFPAGTVAIVHTHPNWMAKPSRMDINTARRVRVPVYVITRFAICKTSGGLVQVVVKGDWTRR